MVCVYYTDEIHEGGLVSDGIAGEELAAVIFVGLAEDLG